MICTFYDTLNFINLTIDKVEQQNKIFKINGAEYLFNSEFTILNLLNYLGFNKNVIVIDFNGTILEKKNWEGTNLQSGDSIEILSIAGGG